MSLEILKIEHNSNPNEERIIIGSQTQTNVGDYVLLLKQKNKDFFEMLLLPDKLILEPNDRLVIYSGIGKGHSITNDSKQLDHTYYFNKAKALYQSAHVEAAYLLDKRDCTKI